MTAAQFRAWMARLDLTIAAAASASILNISPRQIAYYRSGEQMIPRVVALACRVLEAERATEENNPRSG